MNHFGKHSLTGLGLEWRTGACSVGFNWQSRASHKDGYLSPYYETPRDVTNRRYVTRWEWECSVSNTLSWKWTNWLFSVRVGLVHSGPLIDPSARKYVGPLVKMTGVPDYHPSPVCYSHVISWKNLFSLLMQTCFPPARMKEPAPHNTWQAFWRKWEWLHPSSWEDTSCLRSLPAVTP